MKIDKRILQIGTSCNESVAAEWLDPMAEALDRFGIKSPNSVAAFLANVGVESIGLTTFEEKLSYSAYELAVLWPNRFSESQHVQHLTPNADARRLNYRSVETANLLYSNRFGNGEPSTGDGWYFRGAGPLRLRGRNVLREFTLVSGVDLDGRDPVEILSRPKEGSMSAAWLWAFWGCSEMVDAGDFEGAASRVAAHPSHLPRYRAARMEAIKSILAAHLDGATPSATKGRGKLPVATA